MGQPLATKEQREAGAGDLMVDGQRLQHRVEGFTQDGPRHGKCKN